MYVTDYIHLWVPGEENYIDHFYITYVMFKSYLHWKKGANVWPTQATDPGPETHYRPPARRLRDNPQSEAVRLGRLQLSAKGPPPHSRIS